ncbi:hypothetical protein E4U55_004363 [Claviceps digitariae]|nr:hypothetical protein E4U55_004363 [Claviceps digitariae]
MVWARRDRSATITWPDEADRILAEELARRSAESTGPMNIIPRHIERSQLPMKLAGFAVYASQANSIKNLEDVQSLDSSDPKFICIAVAVQFGIDLLCSRRGFRALALGGRRILDTMKQIKPIDKDPLKCKEYAKDFLERIVQDFPVIVLRDLKKGTNGRTYKQDREEQKLHQASIIEINVFRNTLIRKEKLVDMLLNAQQSLQISSNAQQNQQQLSDGRKLERFRTILFRIGVTFAHELCHIFTGYLLGNAGWHTPPNVFHGRPKNIEIGESGRLWEALTFGGSMDMRMGTLMPRVALKHSDGNKIAIIGPRAIARMMNKDFSVLPILEDDFWKTSDAISEYTALGWENDYKDVFDQVDASELVDMGPAVIMSLLSRSDTDQEIWADNLRCFAFESTARLRGIPTLCWSAAAAA